MQNKNRLIRFLMLLGLCLSGAQHDISAQQMENHWWQPVGAVNSIVPDSANGKVYVGGSFNYIGPAASPRFTLLDSANCMPDATIPSADAGVLHSLSDGNGGSYISGSFNTVGGKPRSKLAHILPGGQLSPLFSNLAINGNVYKMATSGNTIYAVGDFTNISKRQPNGNVADGTNGTVIPNGATANGEIKASVPNGTGGWYIAGMFSTVGSARRTALAGITSAGLVSSFFDSMRIGYYNNAAAAPTIRALNVFNNQLYFGGDFSFIGRDQAFGGSVTTAGAYNATFAAAPDGEVKCVIPDGSGGFYIGGDFHKIGNVSRSYLAQINSSGQVTSWDPQVNATVYSLLLDGSTLYIGGSFSRAGGQTRNYIAALNTANGNANGWNPGTNNIVYAIAAGGGSVYLGGAFTQAAGQPRNRIAAVDATTGNLVAAFNPNADGTVRALAFSTTQNQLYAGGNFTNVGGQTRNYLAALLPASGLATSWDPNPSNAVYALLINGSNLYVGGDFTYLYGPGIARSLLASFTLSTGNLNTGFDAGITYTGNPGVRGLSASGPNIYAVGEFSAISSSYVGGAGAFDLATGAQTSWRANCNARINTIAVSGSSVYLGGSFNIFAGLRRDNAACINLTTSQVTAWNPAPAGAVNTIASPSPTSTNQNVMYIGGYFFGIGGNAARYHLAAVDLTNGTATTWAPQPDYYVQNAVVSGNSIIVAGQFGTIGANAAARPYLASVSTANGNASAWTPAPDATVNALTISGSTLFLGGDFSTISSAARSRAAAYTITNPVAPVLAAGFAPSFDGSVYNMAVNGTSLYVTGAFNTVNTVARARFAAVNTANGSLLSWDPAVDGYGNTVSVSSGQVFAGGNYTFINNTARNRALAIDLPSGDITGWNPDLDGTAVELAISGTQVFLGGYFSNVGGQSRPRLASVDATSGAVSTWQPLPNGPVQALSIHNNILYAGGSFNFMDLSSRPYLAAFDNLATTPTLTSFLSSGGTDNVVYTLAASGNLLYVGGAFGTLAGQPRNRIGCIDLSSTIPTPWDPNADNEVYSISPSGNTVYVGGFFQNIGGGNRPYLAALNASVNTNNLNPWAPNPDNYVVSVRAYPGGVAVGGYYINIGGMPARNVVRLNVSTGKADPAWSLNTDGPVNTMALATNQGQLYLGGNFTVLNDVTPRNGLASASTANAAVSAWNPTNNGTVYALLYRTDTVYIGGSFTNLNGVTRGRLAAIRAATNANIAGNPNLDGTVKDIAAYKNLIFATGEFGASGASTRIGLAQFNSAGLGLTSWVNNLDYAAGSSIDVYNNRLYVGGYFFSINGISRTRLAGVDLLTNTVLDFNPAVDGSIFNIMATDDGVYVGGDYYNIGGASRYGIAYLDTLSGFAKEWDAHAGTVPVNYSAFYALGKIGSKILTGGNFTDLRNLHRSNFAVFVQPSTTPAPSPDVQYCYQTGFIQPYLANGTYNPGNLFTAELSDTAGNFSSPIVLGSIASTASGSISCILPANALPGSGYRVRVVSSDPVGIAGLSQWTLTINPLPDSIAAVVTPNGPLTFCQGGNVQLSVPNTAGHSYQWLNPVANIAGATNTTYTATASGAYAVKVTNSFGCNRISSPNVNVTVNPAPTATITPGTTQNVCNGQSVNFQSNAGGGLTFQWLLNGNPISGATNNNYTASVTGNYSVTVTNANNCSNTSASVTLNVNNCGPSIVSITPGNNICQGGAVAVSYNAGGAYNAGNIFTAQLSNSAGSFASPIAIGTLTSVNNGVINATIPAAQAVGAGYRIRVVSSNPAINGADNGSNISIIAQPTAAQAAITTTGALNFCQGGSVSFSVPSTAGMTYQWRVGGSPISGETNNSYVATASGTYSVVVTNAAGCSRNSVNKVVTVNPLPAATITPNTAQTLCAGQTITFQANTGAGLTYQWKNNNANISGATNSSFIANAAGNYSVTVTNSSNCSATSVSVAVTAGSCAATITDTGTLKKCQGAGVTVSFTANGFSAGNIFTLQLSDNAGSFAAAQNIGTLAATSGGSISGVIPGVAAVGNGYKLRITSSNPATTGPTSSLTLDIRGPITDSVKLCAVTVDSASGKNLLIWNKPLSTNIDSFVIYRNSTSAGTYDRIGAQAYGVLSKFLDNTSEPKKMAQRYYITGKNTCGESPVLQIHRTMHLAINKGQNNTTWNLIWNGYEGFPHTKYSIFRGTTASNMALIGEIEANMYNSFTDFSSPTGVVFYMVAVADGPSCNPTAKTTGDFLIGSNIATNATTLPSATWMDMSVWPNPARTTVQVLIQASNSDATFTVKVLDVLGRTVEQFRAMPDVPVNFGERLTPGLYTIEAISDKGDKINRKLVKQ